ncbi:MAG TPA: FHA domain-containing serine/threonine-protein kinase [Trebonia sp.]|nr:FHA domain-containing serine/threonine-protein kinase [Trebonia sp.]
MNDVPSWLVPGSRFAGYRIEEFLGAGGMAAVYRAYHEGMGREVALKVLAASLAGDQAFRRRFVREAHLVAKVEHPHIIPVYEAAQERDVPFIAMRLVRGGDLRAMVSRDGAMPAGRAAAFLSPVASALDTAHEAGLVHRDVKPANMLVDVGRGRPEHVYLSDFGLARGVDTGGLTAGDLTTPGQFMGTPEYAAPEQITGGDVSGRADQYGLGCVAYTLLTGGVPYPREQAIAVMYAQLYDPPPLVTAIRRDLPGSVNKVLARGMEKKAEDRYDSCTAFADALREALGLPPWGAEGTFSYPRGPRGDGDGQPAGYSQTHMAPRPIELTRRPPGRQSGYDTVSGNWTAVVAADRDYYDSVWAADVQPDEIVSFPEVTSERRFPLSGSELLIGRRSVSKGILPEIDLTAPPGGPKTDTGVSRLHAKLVRQEANWSVIDLGTENGTLVNGREIPSGTLVSLRDGDRINLGMWTVITITRD